MPTNEVKIKVTADTNDADRKLKATKTNLREIGERVSFLGMRMTAGFTAPVVGGFLAIQTAGKNAKAEVEKFGVGNVPEEVAKLASAYDDLTEATAPLKTELQGLSADILPIIADLVGDIAPLLSDIVVGVRDLVAGFKDLDPGTQDFILALGGIVVAAGPMITILGESIKIIGTLNTLMPILNGFLTTNAAVTWAAAGPWIALAGAVALLAKVIADNWSTLAKIGVIANMALFGKAPDWMIQMGMKGDNGLLSAGNLTKTPAKVGGKPAGPMLGGVNPGQWQQTIPISQYGPAKPVPAVPTTQNNNITVNTTINTPVNLATAQQAEQVLLPYIFRGLHQAGIGGPR